MSESIEKMAMKTADGTATNIAALKRLFPEIVTEGKVDFDALRTILGDAVAGDERYQFTWAGKRQAMIEAATPITKTLRPCPEESKDWDTTQNLYIEGDNLDVLKILRSTYEGKVKMIYIDPPYNTGHDFIYHDNFHGTKQQELIKEGSVDAETGERFKVNTDSNGYFHSDWCSMMYPRLKLARQLLKDDGVIFISIDDNEVENLRKLCDEVLGEMNFVAQIVWTNKEGGGGSDSHLFKIKHEYILVYTRDVTKVVLNGEKCVEDASYAFSDQYEATRGKYKLIKLNSFSIQYSASLDYPIDLPDGKTIYPSENGKKGCWRWSKEKFEWGVKNGFIEFKKNQQGDYWVYTKQYFRVDNVGSAIVRTLPPMALIDKYSSTMASKQLEQLFGRAGVFDYSKPYLLLKDLIYTANCDDGIILDFFAGSGSMAHAVMQLNAEDGGHRKYIMVQLPEVCAEGSEAAKAGYKNICEIGKERIRRAGEKIAAELKAKAKAKEGELALGDDATGTAASTLDIGFRVFKVADSNVTDVYYAPKEVQQNRLLDMVNNIKPDRRGIDLLYGCLLDWGLPIDLPHEERTVNGHAVFSVGGGVLMACFDDSVDDATVKAIAAEKPAHALFRDTSFVSSAAKINVGEIFKALSPETKVRVL